MLTTESPRQPVPEEATPHPVAANKARRRALIALGAVGALLIVLWFSDTIAGLLPTQPFKPTTQSAGSYHVTLSINPTQPHAGSPITAQFTLTDAKQQPVKTATVAYTWEMVSMDMGTAMGQATANAKTAGNYTTQVTASMGGTWRLVVHIHATDQPDATTSYTVHVHS